MEGFLELNRHKLKFAFTATSIIFFTIALILLLIAYSKGQLPDTTMLVAILLTAAVGFPLFVIAVAYLEWLSKRKVRRRGFSVQPFDQLDKIGITKSFLNNKSKWFFTEEIKQGIVNGIWIECDITREDSKTIYFTALVKPKPIDKAARIQLEQQLKKQNIVLDLEASAILYDLTRPSVSTIQQVESDLIKFTKLLNLVGYEPLWQPPSIHTSSDFTSVNELSQIPSIFDWVFNRDLETATKCAETIHNLLTSQIAYKNKSLYLSLRPIELFNKDLRKFLNFEPDVRNSLYCVASMNSNGYVREKALKHLMKSPTPWTVPFILFRLADWVPKIRKTANDGIKQLIQQQRPQALIRHHKIIDWLLKVERVKLQEIHQDITEFIFSDDSINQITHNLESYEKGERYFIFRNLIARNKLDSDSFDYLIRLLTIRSANLSERPEILKKLLNDKSQKIRHYAINKIAEPQLADFQGELYHLLFDNAAAIRTTCRALLSKLKHNNYAEIYREQITKTPTPGCIVGLSEVGDLSDLYTLSDYLNSDSPKQRSAGLYAIGNLDYAKAREEAYGLLNDSSNTVKKACLSIISKEQTTNDLPKLRDIYDQGTPDTKRFVLKILSKYGGWEIAGDFLKGINEQDEKVMHTACTLLNNWHNYSMRLGIAQKESDKEYVMSIYRSLNLEDLELPYHIRMITREIPFIFGQP